MIYLFTFLEGVLSFLSPCMLPLLPVYLSFFAGNADQGKAKPARILAFILGFTLTFLVLGLLFSALGAFLARWQTAVNLACGVLMVLFGLSCLDVFHLPYLRTGGVRVKVYDTLSAFLFGLVYPLNLTPCVGVFLGAALAMAASAGSTARGTALLLLYALGLGLPFALSAFIMSHLDALFRAVKEHYKIVNDVSGILLILAGMLTACGLLNRWMGLFA